MSLPTAGFNQEKRVMELCTYAPVSMLAKIRVMFFR
jgi:hypothetical protein